MNWLDGARLVLQGVDAGLDIYDVIRDASNPKAGNPQPRVASAYELLLAAAERRKKRRGD